MRKTSAEQQEPPAARRAGAAHRPGRRGARGTRATASARAGTRAADTPTAPTRRGSPAPKNAYDTENASSTARSRCSRRSGGRRNGATNSTHSPIHTHGALTARPNWPGMPARHRPRHLRPGPDLEHAPAAVVDDRPARSPRCACRRPAAGRRTTPASAGRRRTYARAYAGGCSRARRARTRLRRGDPRDRRRVRRYPGGGTSRRAGTSAVRSARRPPATAGGVGDAARLRRPSGARRLAGPLHRGVARPRRVPHAGRAHGDHG